MASATAPGIALALFAVFFIIDRVNRKWLLIYLDHFMIVVMSFLIVLSQRISSIPLYPVVVLMTW